MKRRQFVLVGSGLLLPASGKTEAPRQWIRNTFPSPAHKAHPELFPPGGGADRGEWLTCFGVSPADPRFMLYTFDIGAAAYSSDGRYFQPAELPPESAGVTAAFHPHDGNTGYLLFHRSSTTLPSSGINGIWRTEDKGKTWARIYAVPRGSYEAFKSRGKHLIVVDPHPSRGHHIYFGSFHRGLLRSIDNGKTWREAAFNRRSIKSLAAGIRPGGGTVLYVIAGDEMADQKEGQGPPSPKPHRHGAGALWRIEVAADGSLETFDPQLGFDDVTDVELDPTDPSRGLLLRDPGEGKLRGGRRLYRFEEWGAAAKPLRQAAAGRIFGAVYINPWNHRHVVLTVGGEARDFLQFSTDGGATWNAPRRTVAGCLPDFTTYSAVHHRSANNCLPADSEMQTQGRNVAFVKDSPRTVLFWSTYFDKHPYRSDDYGQTFRPFAYGSPFKQASQIALGPADEVRATGRLEYGINISRDGGSSWRGFHMRNDRTLREIDREFTAKWRPWWRNHTAWGIAIKPDEGNVILSVFGLAAIVRSADYGETWRKVAVIESGEPGYVYWSRQNSRMVYAANQRSTDAGLTWREMSRYVLAISASNGNVIVGTSFLGASRVGATPHDMSSPAILGISTDGGETWSDLPALPQETMPGDGARYNVSVLDYVSHAVAIDPAPDAKGRPRVLVAGRSGIYECDGGRWRVYNRGFVPNRYHRVHEPVPWLGDVQFDPRPGKSHLVYASQTNDQISETTRMRDWAGPRNANKTFPAGQTHRPLYRSNDGGRTWTSLHAPEFGGIPDYLTVSCLEVSATGALYVDGFMGLYSLGA